MEDKAFGEEQELPEFEHKVNGLEVPLFMLQEDVDKLKNFKLYSDDVWVVSFPKSGTTWMQQIVRLIQNRGVQDDMVLSQAAPWLEGMAVYPDIQLDKLSRPRSFKSHMPYDVFPCGPPKTTPCKYIYVARNPKDVAVSFHAFYRMANFMPDIDWNTFWMLYLVGKAGYGNYFDHVLSWWQHRDDKNVLFVKYEDIKKNLAGVIAQIASFIGINLPGDVITKIATLTDFDAMKNDQSAVVMPEGNYKPGAPPFMRRGTVGDWKNHLTPEQSAQMDAICAQRLKDTGLEFDFE